MKCKKPKNVLGVPCQSSWKVTFYTLHLQPVEFVITCSALWSCWNFGNTVICSNCCEGMINVVILQFQFVVMLQFWFFVVGKWQTLIPKRFYLSFVISHNSALPSPKVVIASIIMFSNLILSEFLDLLITRFLCCHLIEALLFIFATSPQHPATLNWLSRKVITMWNWLCWTDWLLWKKIHHMKKSSG